jgi:Na+-driven multidrug efflux pump
MASYYIIGLPFACLFAIYMDFGVLGLTAGMSCGVIAESLSFAVLLGKTDW